MAKACATMGRITVEANMGAIGAIAKYGTEEQLKIAADLVLAGDKPAICISEPNAGSAASEMTTRADKSKRPANTPCLSSDYRGSGTQR